jgi:hypothetical protein
MVPGHRIIDVIEGPPVTFGRASSSLAASARCCTNKIIVIIVMIFHFELRQRHHQWIPNWPE